MDLIYKGINIFLLLALVVFLTRKKVNQHYRAQREELEIKVKKAASEFEKIQAQYKEVEEKHQNLEKHLEDLRAVSVMSVKRESEKVRSEAERLIQKMSNDAQARMQTEAQKLREEFKLELVEGSLAAARAELSGKLAKQDEAWTNRLLGDLAKNNSGSEKPKYASS